MPALQGYWMILQMSKKIHLSENFSVYFIGSHCEAIFFVMLSDSSSVMILPEKRETLSLSVF